MRSLYIRTMFFGTGDWAILTEKYICLFNEESLAKYSNPTKKMNNVERIKKLKRATHHIEKLYLQRVEKGNSCAEMLNRKYAIVYNPVYDYDV